MRKIQIPDCDLNPSVICMGGGSLCVENNDSVVFTLLDTYYQLGGNFIDSANIYGKWLPSGKNICDLNIGKWIKSRNIRNHIVITSKGGHPFLDDMTSPRLSKDEVLFDLDESLTALGCDTIDLYYLHRDDPGIPVEMIIDYLNDFVRVGKIRYFAASNWKPSRIEEAQNYARKSGQQGFSANQLMWSFAIPDTKNLSLPLLENMDETATEFHKKSDLTAIAYESQARGFFQKIGKAGRIPDDLVKIYGNEKNMLRYQRAADLAKELGVKTGDVTLGYILNQSFPGGAVVGCHTPEQLTDSMSAAKLVLTTEQIGYLEGS